MRTENQKLNCHEISSSYLMLKVVDEKKFNFRHCYVMDEG